MNCPKCGSKLDTGYNCTKCDYRYRKSDEFERKCFADAFGKEKQIKEMAEVLSTHFQSELDLTNDISEMAISLFEAGYRKQADVARELAEKAINSLNKYCYIPRQVAFDVGFIEGIKQAQATLMEVAVQYGEEE